MSSSSYSDIEVTVLTEHVTRFTDLCQMHGDTRQQRSPPFARKSPTTGKVCSLTALKFADVLHGHLTAHSYIVENGIAYSAAFNNMSFQSAGTKHIRFSDSGKLIEKVIKKSETIIDVQEVSDYLSSNSIDDLKLLISQRMEIITPMDWSNQSINGKRHQARQLIVPSETPA